MTNIYSNFTSDELIAEVNELVYLIVSDTLDTVREYGAAIPVPDSETAEYLKHLSILSGLSEYAKKVIGMVEQIVFDFTANYLSTGFIPSRKIVTKAVKACAVMGD